MAKRVSVCGGMLAAVAIWMSAIADDVAAAAPAISQPATAVSKWEKEIAAFEAAAAKRPPRKDALLFVGSSSIRMWKLDKSFPDQPTINRGFGGSQLADSVEFAKRIVTRHAPRVVILYAGDNDLQNGKSPEQVLADYRQFVAVVQAELPRTKIVYIGVKPSIARWKLIEKVRATNRLIAEFIASKKTDRLAFVDVEKEMLGEDGKPRAELLLDDGLHLTERGYEVWTRLLTPHLK